MEAVDLLCSRNARSRTPLVGRAQSRIDQAALMKRSRRARRGKGGSQTILLARSTRTMKRCSSDAPNEGQSGCSLGRGRSPAPQLEGVSTIFRMSPFLFRPMRAVKDSPATP